MLTWLTRDKTGRPTWQKARSSRTTSCHQDSVESSGVLRAGAVPSHTLDPVDSEIIKKQIIHFNFTIIKMLS